MPPFALTDGIPEEDSNGRREWNVYDLQNAKSVKESMDAVHGFCGLMAGFEGFIIHTTSEAWIDKLNQIFINSVDKR